MSPAGVEQADKDAFAAPHGRNVDLLFAAIDRTAKLLKVEVSGLENLPSGRVLRTRQRRTARPRAAGLRFSTALAVSRSYGLSFMASVRTPIGTLWRCFARVRGTFPTARRFPNAARSLRRRRVAHAP
jgi:hypothetical protein